jgi:preprotein translocase subunit YajC
MPKLRYDRANCRKCGGSRRDPMLYGQSCWSCRGSGTKITASGTRAKKALERWREENAGIAVDELKVGDIVQIHGGRLAQVESVEHGELERVAANGRTLHLPFVQVEWAHGETTRYVKEMHETGWKVLIAPQEDDVIESYYAFARTLKGVTVVEDEA